MSDNIILVLILFTYLQRNILDPYREIKLKSFPCKDIFYRINSDFFEV